MGVHNVMEDIVHEVLVNYQKQFKLSCECELCLDDIKAIALNNLPPKYVTKDAHIPYARAPHTADRQGADECSSDRHESVPGIVSANPRCK